MRGTRQRGDSGGSKQPTEALEGPWLETVGVIKNRGWRSGGEESRASHGFVEQNGLQRGEIRLKCFPSVWRAGQGVKRWPRERESSYRRRRKGHEKEKRGKLICRGRYWLASSKKLSTGISQARRQRGTRISTGVRAKRIETL